MWVGLQKKRTLKRRVSVEKNPNTAAAWGVASFAELCRYEPDALLTPPRLLQIRIDHALPEQVRPATRVLLRGGLHHVEDKSRRRLVLRVVVPRPEVLDLVADALEQVILVLELLRQAVRVMHTLRYAMAESEQLITAGVAADFIAAIVELLPRDVSAL